jgi:hypothetical protein
MMLAGDTVQCLKPCALTPWRHYVAPHWFYVHYSIVLLYSALLNLHYKTMNSVLDGITLLQGNFWTW